MSDIRNVFHVKNHAHYLKFHCSGYLSLRMIVVTSIARRSHYSLAAAGANFSGPQQVPAFEHLEILRPKHTPQLGRLPATHEVSFHDHAINPVPDVIRS